MKQTAVTKSVIFAAFIAACSPAVAGTWQDQLSSAANQIAAQRSGAPATAADSQPSLSLSSLTGLLHGGNQALSASSMSNAAGILGYCAKQKLTSMTDPTQIKDKLLNKLGLNTPQPSQPQQQDYLQGLAGLLNTGKGEQLNLKSLGDSPLAQKVKTKACDLVLKQAANFIS